MADPAIDEAISALTAAAQAVVERSGPLDGPRPAAPPAGYAAIWILTDKRHPPWSRTVPDARKRPLGGPVIASGTDLMRQHPTPGERARLTGRRVDRVAVEVPGDRVHNP